MMENPHNITPATHLLFVAKNLERIGDHATNVAEMVYFAATGDHLADRAKGADTDRHPAATSRRRWLKASILLVEDDRALVELLDLPFRARGVRGRAAPPTARRRCCSPREQPPDLVILDWMIEGISGHRGLPPAAPACPRPPTCRSSC